MYGDMGLRVEVCVHTDAEAAHGIASRLGLGRVRHVAVQLLWFQERVRAKDLSVQKIKGVDNPADVFTKYLDHNNIIRFMHMFNFFYGHGRAHECPELSELDVLSGQRPS